MCNKINGLAYNQKLCIVSDKCKVNSNIKTPVKSIAYAIRYVRQYKLEDIVVVPWSKYLCLNKYYTNMNKTWQGLLQKIPSTVKMVCRKILSGRGFAKLSTSGGEGSYKELHINSPLRFSHA